MQKTFKSRTKFTWQQNNMDHSLRHGAVLLAKLRWCGRENGYEHYRIERAAFPKELVEVGDGWWNGQPLALKGKTFVEIADIVEKFYSAVFDKLHLIPILSSCD